MTDQATPPTAYDNIVKDFFTHLRYTFDNNVPKKLTWKWAGIIGYVEEHHTYVNEDNEDTIVLHYTYEKRGDSRILSAWRHSLSATVYKIATDSNKGLRKTTTVFLESVNNRPTITKADIMELLNSLPKSEVIIRKQRNLKECENDDECAICLDSDRKFGIWCILPCRHMFHNECLTPLGNLFSCPMCRAETRF